MPSASPKVRRTWAYPGTQRRRGFLMRFYDTALGGQFLRAYAERYNHPPIRNLITFGSQHMGIADMPACKPYDVLCQVVRNVARAGVYNEWAQQNLVQVRTLLPFLLPPARPFLSLRRHSISVTRRSCQSTSPRITSSRRLITRCPRRETRRMPRTSRNSRRSCSYSLSATVLSCQRRVPGSGLTRRRLLRIRRVYWRGRKRKSCLCASSRSTRKTGLDCVRWMSMGVSRSSLAIASTCISPRSVGSRSWRSMLARRDARHGSSVFVPSML